MAVLTVQLTSRSGLNLTDALAAAAGGGDSWVNTGSELLVIVNGGASEITATFPYAATTDGQAITSKTVAVPAGETVIVGPFPQPLFNDASQRASVTYSGVTSVSVAVVRPG